MSLLRRIAALAALSLVALAPASAITKRQLVALLANPYAPAFQYQFVGAANLPSWITYSGPSLATMYDGTGELTYKPNNLLLNTATLSTQSVTTAPINYILSFQGTGTVTLTGTSTAGPLVGSGVSTRVSLAFTPTAGSLTLTVSGSVTSAQLEAVTYQATPSAYNATAGSAYYGPRFDYNPSTLAPNGLLIEEARTNVVLDNRDLTNAAWTLGVTMTSAKNQTGIDGVTNSASSITGGAVSATNTILQAITLASSARFQSAYVKRLVGTGTVNMTTDGGSTWTAITVTANWTRVSIPTQTLANPSVGFQIITNTDSIAVDCVQNENGTFATSAIPTAASSVARSADVITPTSTGKLYALMNSGSSMSMILEFGGLPNFGVNPTSPYGEQGNDGNKDVYFRLRAAGATTVRSYSDDTTTLTATLGGGTFDTSSARVGIAFDNTGRSLVGGGGAVVSDSKIIAPDPPYQFGGPNVYLNGYLRSISAYNSRLPNSILQQKSVVGAPY